jgi:RNase P/RNase MRP subunit p29
MARIGFGGTREGLQVTANISGQVVQISGQAVKISGETVIAKISGETVIAKVSGETVIAKISGEAVRISGETVVTAPWSATDIKTFNIRTITGASGGEVLHSGAIKSVKIKALASNSGDIYIGGPTNRPYSGFGFCLEQGEAEMMDVDDFSRVYLCAQVSGDKVTFDGIN